MRAKQDFLVITFTATADAMAAEKYCMREQIPGRLIPVPREIMAGCGIAFRAAPTEQERLTKAFTAAGLRWATARVMKI